MLRSAPNKLFIDLLIRSELLPEEDIIRCISECQLTGQPLGSFLVKNNYIKSQQLLDMLSNNLGLEVIDLRRTEIDKTVIDRVPVKFASYYKCMPVSVDQGVVTLAVSMPLEVRVRDEIRIHLGLEPRSVLATEEEIEEALKKYYGLASETIDKILTTGTNKQKYSAKDENVEDIETQSDDPSVTRLVNQIILEAYHRRATDIHIEPYRNKVRFRYRVDGALIDANLPPDARHFLQPILSRIKIMANLSITEKRMPQDGSAVVKTSEQQLDLRVSTIPTPRGESMVIRILPSSTSLLNLEKLGFNTDNAQKFRDLVCRPHGVLFVTGPTGSGKTTTLYACLNEINKTDRKIITIEDPIEYEMEGMTQIQINPSVGLDFAKGLRSILRHDPDILMVGEVRDLETAEIAIRTALTGHLVFSTLHTNDAASGVTRLIDMGVEPYLVASSVEAFVAQRLVRVLCPHCKQEDKDVSFDIRREIADSMDERDPYKIKIYKPQGCDYCNGTGYYGRTAIYEILQISESIRNAMFEKPRAEIIKRLAIQGGMRSLRQDGWRNVANGVTSTSEVLQVTIKDDLGAGLAKKENQKSVSPSVATYTSSKTAPTIEEASLIQEIDDVTPEMITAVGQELKQKSAKPRAYEFRAYPRITDSIPVHIMLTKPQDDKPNFLVSDGKEMETITRDVSGAGLQFISKQEVAVGTIIEVRLDLDRNKIKMIECLAKVCRVDQEENAEFAASAYFIDISNNDRVRIHQYAKSKLSTISVN